eukprot:1899046-Prymnesium_polylepis.3
MKTRCKHLHGVSHEEWREVESGDGHEQPHGAAEAQQPPECKRVEGAHGERHARGRRERLAEGGGGAEGGREADGGGHGVAPAQARWKQGGKPDAESKAAVHDRIQAA